MNDFVRRVTTCVATTVGVDQCTKLLADQLAAGSSTGVVVPVGNRHLALGLIGGSPWALVSMMAIMLVAAAYVLLPGVAAGRFSPAAAALTLGGAASNLIDRALLGSVRDFLHVGPCVINLADVAVLVGLACLAANSVGVTPSTTS